jgi:hypothetical protein
MAVAVIVNIFIYSLSNINFILINAVFLYCQYKLK